MKKLVGLVAATAALSGCAAIFDGTTQQIAVNTSPVDAQCKFTRNGSVIANIPSTPSAVVVQKTKHDIIIACSKSGYEDATFINKSGVAGATFANILGGVVTGGIAWAVDSGSGADNKYDSQVNMSLVPSAMVPPAAASPVPATTVTQTTGMNPPLLPGEIACVAEDGSQARLMATACPAPFKPAH
jgi:hypothetical protein